VKKKLAEIKQSLPPGVEVVSGYDRAGLIQDSIKTLQRDLLEESGHRQRCYHRFPVSLPFCSDPNPHTSHRGRRFIHTDVLPRSQFQHYVARWAGAGNWSLGGRRDCHGRERLSPSIRAT